MSKKVNMVGYLLCTWLFSVYLCTHFLHGLSSDSLRDQAHTLLVLLTYGAIYQAPAMLGYWLLRRFRATAIGVTVLLSAVGHLFVFADSHLFDLYGFHINGFVWNLLLSPGGFASLGADQTSDLVVLEYVSALVAVHLGSLLLALQLKDVQIPVCRLAALFLVATLAERVIYGISYAQLYAPVMDRGDAMPLYVPMKMNTFLSYLGADVKKSSKIRLDQGNDTLVYPRHPIVLDKIQRPLNIVFLVSESMRWDLLSPEIMPNLSAFAAKAWNFSAHYSGGNGTRQGLFGLFYGIPGYYWDSFLRNGRGPVLIDVLKDYGYQNFVYTSAQFTYPELDQTIFNEIPKDKLIENHEGEPWIRDETNTTALIDDIKGRDRSKPFFGFMFYEATHARYSFPEHAAVRKDYLETLDYAGLSREELGPKIDGMKARYENAAHGIDIQLQRVVDYLQQSGDLEDTLVIITGDHGEEFMERGRWGHNSAFTDWQVRVPMVVWVPGSLPRQVEQRTSHLDVAATLLPLLGVNNPREDYTLGRDLSEPKDHRTVIVASWSDVGLINDSGKLVVPFKSTTQHHNLASDLDDQPVDAGSLTSKMQTVVVKALADARYYTNRSVEN